MYLSTHANPPKIFPEFCLQQWELLVLQVLNWDLSTVTPYCISDQLVRRLNFESFDVGQVRKILHFIVLNPRRWPLLL
jgi:hypothetical protein